jgi:hypothetical protein
VFEWLAQFRVAVQTLKTMIIPEGPPVAQCPTLLPKFNLIREGQHIFIGDLADEMGYANKF